MAVGTDSGGVKIYSANGQLEQTVLKDVQIRRMSFLSDGRCVVRDLNSVISVYTPDWEKMHVRFDNLTEEVGEEHEQAIIDKQDDIIAENNWHAARIESGGALVSRGMTSQVDSDALIAHDTLWKELEKMLTDFKIDYGKVIDLTRCAAENQFRPVDVEKIPVLGTFEVRNSWMLGEEMSLGKKDSMNSIAPTPDGKMAVGTDSGGVKIYSANGQLEQTVLKDVQIRRMSFLSDGRCVVRDLNSVISVYTPDWEKMHVRFDNLTEEVGEEHEQAIIDKQDDIIAENNWHAARIESGGALVSRGMTSQVDSDALIAHDTLWKSEEDPGLQDDYGSGRQGHQGDTL